MNIKRSLISAMLVCGMIVLQAGLFAVPSSGNGYIQTDDDNGRVVTGKVISAVDNEPIPGAFVVEKGTNNGVMTLDDGSYSIRVMGTNAQLEISCVGFKTGTYEIGKLGIVDVALESDSELDEAIVVGMGTQKKVSVIGAVSSIQGDVLRSSSSNLTSNIAGKLAGVISITNSGDPGAASEFYIRGINTFGGVSTPLILLDDVEISANDLNRIPPESIKSFTVLKDASATAIYGVRGANGVMIVTTKNGSENMRTQVNATVETMLTQPVNMVDFVDGPAWMELYNEAYMARGGQAPVYSQEDIEYTRSGLYPYVYPNVDWKKLLFRDFNFNQRANINVQGGGNKATYYMSLNFNHDTGIAKAPTDYVFNNNLQQYVFNFQNNITYKLTNTTKLDLRLNAQIVQKQGMSESTASLFDYMLNANPVMFPATFPAQQGDEYIRFGSVEVQGGGIRTNPYAAMLDDHGVTKENKLNVVLKIDQDLSMITKGLSVNAMVNWNNWSWSQFKQSITPYYFQLDRSGWSPDTPDMFTQVPIGTAGNKFITETYSEPQSSQTFYFDARLNYNRSFGKHNVGALLMYLMRDYMPNRALSQRNQGLSGRVTYDYAERYFVELNFGYNGTERLAKGSRFEFFPSASIGWVPSNEKFWEPAKDVIDYLKLRASYGIVGSDGFDCYNHFVYFDSISLNGGGTAFFGPSTDNATQYHSHSIGAYKVDNATWERSHKLDIGMDFTLFSQLDVTVDWFYDKRDRIMMRRGSWPYVSGYWNAVPWGQVGEASSRGIEFSLNWAKNFGRDWRLEARANFTYTKNQYDFYDEPQYSQPWTSRVGRPLDNYYMWGYVADGLFVDQADIDNHAEQQLGSTVRPGDVKYRDINGDGVITTDDQIQISPYGRLPRIQYGFGFNVMWKKWDLGVFFNGSAMRTIAISGLVPFGSNACNVIDYIAENRWSEMDPDPNASYPRLGVNAGDVRNNFESSTYWLRDGSFLRFKTLEIGYSFKIARVYLNGDNLAVFSPFKLWDPELNWNAYPFSRTFTLGVQFRF